MILSQMREQAPVVNDLRVHRIPGSARNIGDDQAFLTQADVYEFYNLGIGDPHPISAVNKLGLGDLLDEVLALFPEGEDPRRSPYARSYNAPAPPSPCSSGEDQPYL